MSTMSAPSGSAIRQVPGRLRRAEPARFHVVQDVVQALSDTVGEVTHAPTVGLEMDTGETQPTARMTA